MGRRGLTEEQLLGRMEDWVEKRDGNSVTGFTLKDSSGKEYSAFRLEDGDGRAKRYVVPNHDEKEGWGWRVINEDTYKKYKAGFDIDRPMPTPSLITGPGGDAPNRPLTEVRERVANYIDIPGQSYRQLLGYYEGDVITRDVDLGEVRANMEARKRGVQNPQQEAKTAQTIPETPKTENVAQAKPASNADVKIDAPAAVVAKPVQMAATGSAVGGAQRIEASAPKSPYVDDQYLDSQKFYSEVEARGNRYFKPGNSENGMILEVDKQGRVIRGIERDLSDPTKATVKQGAGLVDALESQGMSIQSAERSAARIFGDVDQMQKRAPQLAVTAPNLAM